MTEDTDREEETMGEISMTLSSTHLELEEGKGAVSASVTNTSAEPQQLILAAFDESGPSAAVGGGTASPTGSGGPAPASSVPWVSVENPHRSIPPGRTEAFTVAFDGTEKPAGTYVVKLIAYSADQNPEDNRGESATVTVVVKDPPPPRPEKKKIPWWVFVVAAVVLLGIGAAVFFLLQRDPEVPDVVGIPVEEAVSVLSENDFRIAADFNYVQSDEPVDTVVGQTPAAGTRAEAGSTVALDLAAPRTVEVPPVVGQPATAAADRLVAAGLRPLFPPGVPCTNTLNPDRCTVNVQFPQSGSDQPLDSEVVLFTVREIDDGPRPTFTPPCRPYPRCLLVRDDFVIEEAFPGEVDPRLLDDGVFDFREDRFLELEERVR